jgi:hypothetical protein
MSVLYENRVVSQRIVSELIETFKTGRTSVKLEEGAGCPSMSITDANTVVRDVMLQNRRVTVNEVAHQLQISHGFSLVKLSTTGLPSIKSEHDGSQSNSQNGTKRNVWTSANGLFIAVVLKVTTSWKEWLREIKHGSTTMIQRVNTRVWNGNILIHPPRKSSKRIQPQESLCLQIQGIKRVATGTL